MRLTELMLERYGSFSKRSLTIPAESGLAIIYGPNEAGKSTCLAAVSDFLFGIPKSTPHAAVFGSDGMRLGATVVDANGVAFTLRRRCGRVRTLTDASGNPVNDSVISRLLGATTRARFRTLFGLNHETLRSGGEGLLEADGEIGRLIVEAGGGLRSLMARLATVDAEADKLFASRRSTNRIFYQALDDFQAADHNVKRGLMTQAAYEQARKTTISTQEQLDNLRVSRRAADVEISHLERLIRAFPHLSELDRITSALTEYSDLSYLPVNFHQQVDAALDNLKTAGEALEASRVKRDRLLARYEGLFVDPVFLDAEAQIRDVIEQATHVRKARSDRTNRLLELESAEAQLAALRNMLHLPTDADIAVRMPDQAALDHVQNIANQEIERDARIDVERDRVIGMQDKLATLRRRLEAAAAAGFDKPSGYNVAQFAGLVSQVTAAATARQETEVANCAIFRTLVAAGFDSAEALETFTSPSIEAIQAEQAWHTERDAKLAEHIRRRAEAEDSIKRARNAIAQYGADGPVASDATLAEARSIRAEKWVPLHRAYLENKLPSDVTIRRATISSFENAVGIADDLADRRAIEADRAANLVLAHKQLADGTIAYETCETLINELRKQKEDRSAIFSDAFPQASLRFPELPALLEFAERRRGINEALKEASLKELNANRLEAELIPLQELFAQALKEKGITTSGEQNLAVQVQALNVALSYHDTEHADYRRDLRDRDNDRPTTERAQQQLENMVADQRRWQLQWPLALNALGLNTGISPAYAGTLISEWSRARGTLSAIEHIKKRLERMDEDEATLNASVMALGIVLCLEISDDSVAAADFIAKRWKDQDNARQQRDALAPEIEETGAEYSALMKANERAMNAVSQLVQQANISADGNALIETAARCRTKAAILQAILQAERSIADVDDGLGADLLRNQLEARSIDELRGSLASVRESLQQLDSETEKAVLAHKSAQDEFERRVAESDVNAAIALRENASTRMQTTVERYIELTVARSLITNAIERIRNEQQDPLIRRTGELFSYTTHNTFSHIETDIDNKGQPVVVGIRQSGGRVSVTEMSDGTRDQLFLAFRLASLENYATSAEPLPFIADDLLVHFDDDRSSATLDLLAQFGETSQVLLFTHHRSVRDNARRLEARGLASIIELA